MQVCRPVSAAPLVTGPEARPGGSPRAPGEIWDVNAPMLLDLLSEAERHIEGARRLHDDAATLACTRSRCLAVFILIITTGGASVGETDVLAHALERVGARVWLRGVAFEAG
jgi:molybdopterin molybdotransferase